MSTDPASNLDAVLGTPLGLRPTKIAGSSGVDALNINPEQATFDYRERTIAPYRGVLPEMEVALLQERLSGACTVEVAAFDEFALLLSDPDMTAVYDHVIFDTAPTGHTLRLLELPAAWTGFLEAAPGDVSVLDRCRASRRSTKDMKPQCGRWQTRQRPQSFSSLGPTVSLSLKRRGRATNSHPRYDQPAIGH